MRPQIVNCEINGRRRFVDREPRSHGKCHSRVDKRRSNAAVQNYAGLAQVVADFDAYNGFVGL